MRAPLTTAVREPHGSSEHPAPSRSSASGTIPRGPHPSDVARMGREDSIARRFSVCHHAAFPSFQLEEAVMRRALPAAFVTSAALVLLAVSPAPRAAAPAAAKESRFAIHAAHLIDGRASAARGPVWVVVSGDTVESVRASAPSDLTIVELGDA